MSWSIADMEREAAALVPRSTDSPAVVSEAAQSQVNGNGKRSFSGGGQSADPARSTRQNSSASGSVASSTSPSGVAVVTPLPAVQGAGSSSDAAAAPSALPSSSNGSFDPVAAGLVPDNLLFGQFGAFGVESLRLIDQMKLDELRKFAVVLGFFPDSSSLTGVCAAQLRALVLNATGAADGFDFDSSSRSYSFDGLVRQRPHFREPA